MSMQSQRRTQCLLHAEQGKVKSEDWGGGCSLSDTYAEIWTLCYNTTLMFEFN